MNQVAAPPRPTATASPADAIAPAAQALVLLRVGFTIAPIIFGLDKLFELTADWSTYLWPPVASVLPLSADQIMIAVGFVEIAAGVLVAVRPRIGGLVVAAWLTGIIVNLLLLGDFYDIALRDVGLLLGALALARLATAFPHVGFGWRQRT